MLLWQRLREPSSSPLFWRPSEVFASEARNFVNIVASHAALHSRVWSASETRLGLRSAIHKEVFTGNLRIAHSVLQRSSPAPYASGRIRLQGPRDLHDYDPPTPRSSSLTRVSHLSTAPTATPAATPTATRTTASTASTSPATASSNSTATACPFPSSSPSLPSAPSAPSQLLLPNACPIHFRHLQAPSFPHLFFSYTVFVSVRWHFDHSGLKRLRLSPTTHLIAPPPRACLPTL